MDLIEQILVTQLTNAEPSLIRNNDLSFELDPTIGAYFVRDTSAMGWAGLYANDGSLSLRARLHGNPPPSIEINRQQAAAIDATADDACL